MFYIKKILTAPPKYSELSIYFDKKEIVSTFDGRYSLISSEMIVIINPKEIRIECFAGEIHTVYSYY